MKTFKVTNTEDLWAVCSAAVHGAGSEPYLVQLGTVLLNITPSVPKIFVKTLICLHS